MELSFADWDSLRRRRMTLQSFRFKVTMCNVEGTTVPVQNLPPHVKTWAQHYLSETVTWDDWLFEDSDITYAAIFSVGLQTYSDAFEARLIAECAPTDRNRLIRDLERVFHYRSFDGYSVQRITVVVPEWGGEPPPGGEPEEGDVVPEEDVPLVHELWVGQGPFRVEHIITSDRGQRYRARAVWRNRRLYWTDRNLTYVFSDLDSWREAHVEKLRELLGITVAEMRVIRKA